jgi:putative membrane protein
MQTYLVGALVFALMVAVFAVQNTRAVDVNFIFWRLNDISLVLVILGSAAVGAVVVFLLGTFKQIGLYKKTKELEKNNKELLKELEAIRVKDDAQDDIDQLPDKEKKPEETTNNRIEGEEKH